MIKSTEHKGTTKNLFKKDIPIYFSDQVIPLNFVDKTITFKNNQLAIRLVPVGTQLISLPYAPWGSFQFNDSADYDSFTMLVQEIKSFAKSNNIQKIIVKAPPSIYDQNLPGQWFQKEGFSVTREINQHIDLINPVPLHGMEKRKLKKASTRFRFKSCNDFSKAYDLISSWRKSSNIPLNIEAKHLNHLFNKYPSRYECWEAVENESPISICVTIKVTETIVYYFLPATSPSHRKDSPMVYLIDHMTKKFQEQGFSIFDLGQSSIDGRKQEGLFQFKERMGATTHDKLIYELAI